MSLLSRVRLFVTPQTVAYEAPPSMGFSRQEYWSGLPFSSTGDLPDPGIELGSPALQADALPSKPPGKPELIHAAAAAKLIQSCPTLCDPIDGSPPGSTIPGILQARTLVGCHFLLSCMEVKSESEVAQSCPTLSDPMDCSLLGSTIHGIFQARVLEWVAIVVSAYWGFPCGSAGGESACNVGDLGSIPGLGRSPGEGKGCPLQYSGLGNSMECLLW